MLVWWLSRHRAGSADRRSLHEPISRALALEPWLLASGGAVVAEARTWSAIGA